MSRTKSTGHAAVTPDAAHHQLHNAIYRALRIVETYDLPDSETTRGLAKVARGLVTLLEQAPEGLTTRRSGRRMERPRWALLIQRTNQ
jgi:hypothetical protein